jgi:hypothetical protein
VQVPSFTITKLLWLKRHDPDVWAKVASVLLPHDYMNFWLTGRKVTEVSLIVGNSVACGQVLAVKCLNMHLQGACAIDEAWGTFKGSLGSVMGVRLSLPSLP